jgi:hypothetical protein
MAVLNAYQQLTLKELANRKDPSGNAAVIAEVLQKTNAILKDAIWLEANDTFSNVITQRYSLPTGTWRLLNQGVTRSATATRVIRETVGSLEDYCDTDKMIVDASPNPAQFRMGEARGHIEGLSQTLAAAMFYSNAAVTPEQMTGFAPRLDSLATGLYSNCLAVGTPGAGSINTSIYLVQWGPDKVHMTYPKGHPNFGVEHRDLGEVTLLDGSNNPYQGYRDWFGVRGGLSVHNERCIARAANILSTSTTIDDTLIKLLDAMWGAGVGAVIYCNKTIFDWLNIDAKDKSNVWYRAQDAWGDEVLWFRQHPVRLVEQIVQTEGTLT